MKYNQDKCRVLQSSNPTLRLVNKARKTEISKMLEVNVTITIEFFHFQIRCYRVVLLT